MVREFEYRVASSEVVGDALVRTVIEVGELAGLLAAGQFLNLRVPGNDAEVLRVPLSFAGADAAAGTVELVYAVVGDGTRRLAALRAGEGATVLGPCGRGWRPAGPDGAEGATVLGPCGREWRPEGPDGAECGRGRVLLVAGPDGAEGGRGRVLLVAGGIGVTPIVAAGRALAGAGVPFDAVVAAQTASRLWGTDVLRGLGARVVVCTDDGSAGVAGFATVAVPQMLAERAYDEVWTCGPAPMMAGIARLAELAGLACQASLERMMGCGFGACHCCNVELAGGGHAFCCTDGPVFDAQEVAW